MRRTCNHKKGEGLIADYRAMELAKREFAREEQAPTKSEKAEEKKEEEEEPEEMSFLEKLLTDKYNQMMAEPEPVGAADKSSPWSGERG